MRRKEREISDINAIERFIREQRIMRIGLYDDGEIYIVPVNYGYERSGEEFIFYFHGAKAGRKYKLAEKEPNAGFEIDGEFRLLTAEKACGYSANYRSVIGSGRLSIVRDEEEKIKALNCLMRQLSGKTGFSYTKETLGATAVFRLKAEKLSCKAKS